MDLRRTLDRLRIPWKDRGPNTSQGHVNIPCPMCGLSDPSMHMTIREEDGVYYCFRGGREHSGHDLARLLIKASRQPRDKVLAAIGNRSVRPTRLRTVADDLKNYSVEPLREGPALAYLASRFSLTKDEAYVLAQETGLLKAKIGRLAYRVIVPILDQQGVLRAYSGRAVVAGMQPRYLIVGDVGGLLYFPVPVKPDDTVFLVEGAFDALQIYQVMRWRNLPIAGAALLGSQLSEHKIALLKKLPIRRLIYVPDKDVPRLKVAKDVRQLNAAKFRFEFSVKELPEGVKDLAEMTFQDAESQLISWFNSI